ncbi:unnamed protein product [Trifolium pratense]|uniref:Uncharacterized protein n=1 Tax=Trifolium pratense TaxID=57577 RepID=A0ACB0KHE8_TRIPR|nr:unnamed protein product [Trifolium pratense]
MASEGSSSGFVQPSIPKLDGHYDHWSMLMENFLRSKEYWGLIEEGIPEVRDEAALNEAQLKARNDLKLKDLKAKNYLYQAIDRVVLETILKKNTSKDIWDSLKKKYQGTSRVKRAQLQALRKEFEILHMKAGESVNEYFARTLTIANRMRIHGEKMEDVTIIEKILRSMTSKFDYVVCSIEESNDIDTMSVDELQSSLLVHEQRMSNQIEEEQALKVTHIENSSSRFRGRGGFRGRGRGRARGSFDKSSIECYNCHQNGHFQWECPGKTEGKANFVETDEEEILLMAYMDNNMSVMGKGSVKLLMNKKMQNINDVYYVPELKSNLISLGQLQETGCAILIQKGSCQIHDPKEGLVAEVKMSGNRMFQLKPESFDNQTCLKASISDPSWFWHYRFGHLNFNGLRVLQQKEMVKGLPQIETPSHVCEECLIAKQHRNSFPQESTWRASHVLQLVHSDICGPMNPTSNSNKRYFITFTDDFSRKTWVYFLKEKSEALEMFRKFKARVEKEKNQPIQCLRTDRGGEYTSSEFVNLCESNGIKRQLTAAYTPHQNGVSERRNITIMNMVRSMLTNKNVPKTFWPEAVNWSVHILNRCPTFSVKNMTPEEAWCGHKPAVDHFRVFGSIAYVHVPDQKRKKLDNKGEKCVLLGVSEESKAYRLYNPLTKKICISKDVVFDENNSWNWENLDKEKSVALELEDHESVEAENDAHGVREESNELESDHGSETAETSLQNMQRPRRKPGWMDDYTSGEEFSEEETLAHFALLAGSDPIAFDEAIKSSRWRKAMDAEIEAIEKNNTWELVELPKGEKAVGVKWIYKTKVNEKGEIDKFKARLVAKGYTQKYGIDYSEVFAPVARHDTIRMVIALAALNNWTVFQLDVKSAFLHGELVEQVFVEQPPGYVKQSMMKEFEMTDLGMMKYFLGIEVVQSAAGIFICQKKYAQEVLERFKMDDCNPVQIPIVPGTKLTRDVEGTKIDNTYYKQMVGSLMYITATRPDLTYAVSLISSDSDYAGDLDDRKSTSGYVFLLSGAAVSWSSKKQPVVTLSTTEAEFIAAASCVCQGIWLRRILEEVKHTQQGPLMLFCDNSSTIKLSKNPVLHGRSKHIDVRFHFLRDLTKEEVVKLCYCRSDEQIADIFTKPLKVDSFMKLRALLGMCSIEEIN